MKITPSFDAFCRMSKKGNLIPVYGEILADLETPVSSFLKLRTGGRSCLLESAEAGRSGRYSFVGLNATAEIIHEDGVTFSIENGKKSILSKNEDPTLALQKYMTRFRYVESPDLPRFSGGAVGYISYDCNRYFDKAGKLKGKAVAPEMLFMLMKEILIFDHLKRSLLIVVNTSIPAGAKAKDLKSYYHEAVTKIEATRRKLSQVAVDGERPSQREKVDMTVKSTFTKAQFVKSVKRIKEDIKAGDAIQVVLSQRFERKTPADGFSIYRSLRSINPSPYMFYLNCNGFEVVGSSPETHVKCEEGEIELRPIAGTRKRGANAAEDAKLAKELLADPKERAEHLMLVDLGRNDLGRVSAMGSVKVSEFMVIENYSHVMHIVSRVVSKLAAKKNAFDVVRATFPAGTVSGAPKVKAMQIISREEPSRRGLYAGLVGYLGFSGNFDSCIAIRTMLLRDGVAFIQAGAGIVADSEPEKEFEETRNKARGLFRALELAEKGLA